MGIRRILSRHNLSPAECSRHITSYTLTDTPLESSCESLHKSCSQEEILSQYRSIDGTCNHKNDGTQGSAFTAYKRLLHPEYLDGVQEPRRAVSKKQLPSARLVSGTLVRRLDDSNSDLTLAMMLWSEFVEHDLSHTATSKMGIYEVSVECFFY
jgi:peroxidase